MGLLQDAFSGLKSGVSDLWGGITGSTGAEAAQRGAQLQTQFGREALGLLREDLGPVRNTLETSLPALQNFVTGGESALDNPLFKRLSDMVSQKTLAAQAAGGRVGAGDTGTALADALIPLAMNFRTQRFNELFNFANLGSNAAAQTGTQGANLLTQIGNAQAAGGIGAANARQAGAGNLIQLGGTLAAALSDKRFKKNIKKLGKIKEVGVYKYQYFDDDEHTHIGVMAQDVEKHYPDVIEEHDGVKFVNYDLLNEKMGGELYGT